MVGVLLSEDGDALLAQRTKDQSHAGGWEFPGGKLEPGEERLAGLARELREELGIEIGPPRPLLRVLHRYPYGEVLLDVWVVRRFHGHPIGLDGQELRWCPIRDLPRANLLAADKPIVDALALPERIVCLSTEAYSIRSFSTKSQIERAAGLRGILCVNAAEASEAALRKADFLVLGRPLPDSELAELCLSISQPIFACGVDLETSWRLGATGVNQLGS